MLHLISLKDWSPELIGEVLDLADDVKKQPARYATAMAGKTLLMIFEKPSLRTRVSFETGVTQMGGHAIYYDMGTSPLGAGKENIADTARVISRYVDVVMARLFKHEVIVELARHATIPVINALTDHSHPTQIMADLQTIREKKGRLNGLKLAYLGDGCNNVTYSLLFGCTKMGVDIRVACPPGPDYSPASEVTRSAQALAKKAGSQVLITHDAIEAVRGADVVYTDSWMSYHVAHEKLEERVRVFTPYQVNATLMQQAAPDAIFMNCLPALRGFEQTAEVMDGSQSVVFDEAENRLHAHKAILLKLLEAAKK
ncbi:MAG: ornithine carbamoyltransferase [Verrucomicrobia bacterium]|nr:MAG: ornithine carbamoyltransferase [Verrucomicrobiota bacterium]